MYELGFPVAPSTMVFDSAHSIPATGVVTWHFKTPASFNPKQYGSLVLVEFASSDGGAAIPTPRTGALNYTPGDVTTMIGPSMASGAFASDKAPSVPLCSAGTTGGKGGPVNNYFPLKPNTDYYFNVENTPGTTQAGVANFGVKVSLTFTPAHSH